MLDDADFVINVNVKQILESKAFTKHARQHIEELLKHEAVPNCGSYESDFRTVGPSQFFDWDDLLNSRLRPEILTSEEAE